MKISKAFDNLLFLDSLSPLIAQISGDKKKEA
jgi:hypothetical protein